MAVKVIKKDLKKQSEFPCLKEHDGLIVLFNSAGRGTVIANTSDLEREVGHYSNHWSYNFFTPFNGTLELQNEMG